MDPCLAETLLNASKTTQKICRRTHDAIITSLLRQNDIVTSFWRNDDFIIASFVGKRIHMNW